MSVECPFLNTNWFSVVSRFDVKSSSNIISNVIETMVTSIISLYLFTLLVSQSGLSCESQLIETVHNWITAIDNKTQIDAILLDFAKTFEKVPHKRLLSKVAFYGITGNTKNWIKSFLSHRKQRGSVLGPVLFLLYINDINNIIQSPIQLFADDSIIYRIIKSETDNNILQSDLIQLQTWSNKWQMEFNIPKCVHLPITNKTKPRLHSYSLCGVPLSTVSSHPYLGIKLDTKVTWAKF